jgi:hypothetical protein
MPTSGVIDTLLTARGVVHMAGELTGEVVEGQPALPAYQAQLYLRHLNWLLKSMTADGCNLWRQFEDTATFTSGTASVDLTPRVMDVLEARLVQADGSHRPLARWERGEYVSIPNKTQSGAPTAYTLAEAIDDATALPVRTMTVWPVPASDTDVIYTAAAVIQDVTSLNDHLDVPQHWTECLAYKLADRVNAVLGASASASGISIKQRADILYQLMRDNDRPASYFLQPVGR